MSASILVIDDDPDFLELIAKHLRARKHAVLTASTAEAGAALVKEREPAIALVDVKLPDMSGVDLVSVLKSIEEELQIIMVSGFGEPKLVVAAMQAGATDYIQKPIEMPELLEKIDGLLELRRDISTERSLEEGVVIGQSSATKQLIRDISKVAHADAPVLLRGESGTGKSLVAEVIHAHSPRCDRPFVTVTCPAIPESLLESELFGHTKGAFTGAVRDKMGKFELADGGTIFLDEIGELPPALQAKLLRVLQNGECERIGSLQTLCVDVRVIAATNRDLERAIEERRFREDLFYRLNVLPIVIPPLRERRKDIEPLARHFLRLFARKADKRLEALSDEIVHKLCAYPWPGNVRELQNVIERAVVIGKEPRLRSEDIIVAPLAGAPAEESREGIASLGDLEQRALIRALEESGGNVSRAARILGVGRDTVYRRLRKYGIEIKR